MEKTVRAVYQKGVLGPSHLPLLASAEEWADEADDDVSLDEVRQALSTIRVSLSEAIVEERRDR